mgnify:CR=1 FL=1|jgi:hypothetical protein|tara:strand:+ start:431 stop:1174 length:744 start_codon:yes stop_codon:yes gene_type:complete
MAAPTTRATLQEYCLRSLGSPVIEINVDDDQIEDRTDDAIQFYQTWHDDAILRTYLKHELTATDITNNYITVSDHITSVVRMLKINSTAGNALFDVGYHMRLNDVFMVGGMTSQIQNYEQKLQHLSLIESQLNTEEHIRYSRHMDRLHMDEGFGDLKAGSFIVIECYQIVDPSAYAQIYNDLFLKKYLTALIKRQWGANMMKFEGFQLPGGITMNGRQMFDDAIEELQRLEEEVALTWMTPDNFIMG